MMCRGVRGATIAASNDADEIIAATRELLEAIVDANGIVEDDLASVFFTMTVDLNAAFPAQAARQIGWRRVALLDSQEIDNPDGMELCIRVLIHWNTARSLDQIQHVYMRGAERLRPDMYPDNKLVLKGDAKNS